MDQPFKPFSPEKMTAVAYQQLYESINTSRLIAYVGSGLSLVYGNVTWDDFVGAIVEELKKEMEKARKRVPRDSPDATAIGRVEAQIGALRARRDGEAIVVLELVRQAFWLVDDLNESERGSCYRAALVKIFDGDRTFIADALGRRLAWAGLTCPEDIGEDASPKDFYARVARMYDLGSLKSLAAATGDRRLIRLAARLADEEPDRQRRGDSLPIDRRSLLCIFLAAARVAGVTGAFPWREERQGTVPPRPLLDPLQELYRTLGIRRFFTTNYDLEIENLLMLDELRDDNRRPVRGDELRARIGREPGFDTQLGGTAILRTRTDGATVRSDVNDGSLTAPLVEFAIGNIKGQVHIYHHHGRIDRPATMVAADGEYNRMYRAEGLNRPSLDRAYDSMIDGNPILFVGFGLSEIELTRTLRKRVSNPRPGRRAPVFVLRPAEADPAKLLSEQMNLFTKLGVQVIHFGHPRRGARYSLASHRELLNAIALQFALKRVDNRWRPDPAAAGAGIAGPSRARIRDLSGQFRLLHDLDLDRCAAKWLLSPGGRALAERIRAHVAATEDSGPQELIADYLEMLESKLTTAALRHELRQIGREARQHFSRKASRITPRQLPRPPETSVMARHISIDLCARDPAEAAPHVFQWSPDQWRWSQARFTQEVGQEMSREMVSYFSALTANLKGQGQSRTRDVILGERGIGKGSFLKALIADIKDDRPQSLILNCCYGQEIDTVASLIHSFLHGGAEATATRREDILGYSCGSRPKQLIVLAAVDRLFGTDGVPLGAEVEWLLNTLLRPEFDADVLITGSMRCAKYLKALLFTFGNLAASGSSRAQYSFVTVTGKGRRSSSHAKIGSGYLLKLYDQWDRREEGRVSHDPEQASIRMAQGSRLIELIVGREIEALLDDHEVDAQLDDRGIEALRDDRRLRHLAQEILKAIAFIGIPIEAEVLLSVPEVRRQLNSVTNSAGASSVELLAHALSHAAGRNLLDVIEPYRGGPQPIDLLACHDVRERVGAAIANRNRFVIHRLVSQVFLDRFGIPAGETVLSDSYNISLYAAQRSDAPASSPHVTQSLEQLVDSLMNGWRDVKVESELETGISSLRGHLLKASVYATEPLVPELLSRLRRFDRELRMMDPVVPGLLRAAGGVIRGYFSAMNLLSLDLDDPRGRSAVTSVVTAQKRRIRRLLDFAVEAQHVRETAPDALQAEMKRNLMQTEVLATVKTDRTNAAQQLAPEWIPTLGDTSVETQIEKMLKGIADGVAARARRLIVQDASHPATPARSAGDTTNQTLYPFYAEEIVWLFNERAMLSLAQGDLYTASTTFALAFDANRRIEGDRYQPNRCRLTLNRALLWIERGQISNARDDLAKLEDGVGSAPDGISRGSREAKLIAALATGYKALCDQLNGITDRADRLYREALEILTDLGELRAIALFQYHRGSLHHGAAIGREESGLCFARAAEAAEGGRHTDILYRIRVAQVQNDWTRKAITAPKALAILNAAIDYAEELDMHRVAVEALGVRTWLRLDLGDIESASIDCSRALAIASQYGMTLRRIWLRVLTGRVYEERGDTANARFMYERAIDAAERIGYQRAIEVGSLNLLHLPRD